MIVCTPVGACGEAARAIAPALKPGCIVSDVGSVKQTVIADMQPHIPAGVHFVPAHPVAGTENSGPEAALRRPVRGPLVHPDAAARSDRRRGRQARGLLEGAGQRGRPARPAPTTTASSPSPRTCRTSSPTPSSARPTISAAISTARCCSFAAGGFRDFTRIAASDPTMWRDVFMNNREAVLEVLAALPGGPVLPAARHPLGRGRQAVRPVHAHPRDPPRADPSPPGVSSDDRQTLEARPGWLGLRLRLADVEPGLRHARDAAGARLHGWHRAFCIYSEHYRGTPQKPGLILGLLPAAPAAASPIACRPNGYDAVRRYLMASRDRQ